MTESTLVVGYEINAQLAKEKIQKSKGLMGRLKKTDAKEVVSLVTKAWNELESILESDGHQCDSRVLYTAELNAFSEVKSNSTTIVNNSFLLSIITADVDTKFEAVKNERYVVYSKASEFEQNQFSIYLSEIEANFDNQEIGIFSWFSAPTDDLARIQKRVAGSFPASMGGELHFFEFHNDGLIFPNFADVETQRFEGKLAGNYSLKFDAAVCSVGIRSLNDITTRLFGVDIIADGAKNQTSSKKKVKNESLSVSNEPKVKKTYSDDFKRRVAVAAVKKGNTLQAVAEEFGISATLVRNWKNKFTEESNSKDKSRDSNRASKASSKSVVNTVLSIGYIPKDNRNDWILCGDPETSGTYELTVRFSAKDALFVESGKQFTLTKSDLKNATRKTFPSFLNQINKEISSPDISDSLFTSVWNYLDSGGQLPAGATLVAGDEGEFANENYGDGNHYYFRIQTEVNGEYSNEKVIVFDMANLKTDEITNPMELTQAVVAKYSQHKNFEMLDEVLQDIEENGAGYDELSQLGYLLDYDFSDSLLALNALKLCFDAASSKAEKDYVAEIVMGLIDNLEGDISEQIQNANEFIKYIENWSSNLPKDDSKEGATMKKLSDEVLQELFEEKEESLDDKATFATVVSEAGGNLYNVQLDVDFNEDGTWDFVARLICEEIVSLPDSARQFVEDKLEEIGDELYSDFEKFGLDPQMMGDYKVEVTDE